jgi:hypothetical protein
MTLTLVPSNLQLHKRLNLASRTVRRRASIDTSTIFSHSSSNLLVAAHKVASGLGNGASTSSLKISTILTFQRSRRRSDPASRTVRRRASVDTSTMSQIHRLVCSCT